MAGESTLELVTGYRGKAHVTAGDARALNAGIVGSGTYVLPEGNGLAAEMVDSNTLRVQSGTLLIQGCQCRVRAGEYVDVKIRNGSQAMKRNDIVVARWEKQAAEPRTESVELKVIEGTPSSKAAEDPAHTEGDLSSDLVAEFPLWRIPLDGITVGTPVPLYKKLVSIDALGDSVSQAKLAVGTTVLNPAGNVFCNLMSYNDAASELGCSVADFAKNGAPSARLACFVSNGDPTANVTGAMHAELNDAEKKVRVRFGQAAGGAMRVNWMLALNTRP